MTPISRMGGAPSLTPVNLNGGILRMNTSWDAAGYAIPNRCLSAYVIVCPCSFMNWRERDLPPPRAPGMCGSNPANSDGCDGQVRPTLTATGTCEVLPRKIGIIPLDSKRFIDTAYYGFLRLFEKFRKNCGSNGSDGIGDQRRLRNYPLLSAIIRLFERFHPLGFAPSVSQCPHK